MMTILERYQKVALPELKKEFGFSNALAAPRLRKVVVNIGTGRIRDPKQLEIIEKSFMAITGQKPVERKAKKAIASFKTRAGMGIGYSTTLRGRRMYDFLDRLVGAALPRTRDFRGIPQSSFDEKGNLTIGVKEHIVFPEMIGEDVRFIFSLEATIVTTAKSRAEGIALLRHMGFPIQK